MLTDSFQRKINYLRISVTDRCNLRCRYCVDGNFPFIPHSEILTYEEILKFVRICAEMGIEKVRLTGGEPLVRRRIEYLVKEITLIGGIRDVSLTTNGILLEEKLESLVSAGLKRINVSLDTLKRERFEYLTGLDGLKRVIRGIERSLEAGLNPVKINTVIIKGINDDEITDFVRLAERYDLEVRFIEFMPFGEEGFWTKDKVVTSQAILDEVKKSFELKKIDDFRNGPASVYEIEGGKGRIGFISPISSHFCERCNRLRLTSKGMIRPCLFSQTEYDVRYLLRNSAPEEEIKSLILRAVREKPEKKEEEGRIKKCQRSLRHIGG